MDGELQYGFQVPQDKGLFTFYKEQEQHQRVMKHKETDILTIKLGKRLHNLTPAHKKKDISFFQLSPHFLREQYSTNIIKKPLIALPSSKMSNRSRILRTPLSGSSQIQQHTNFFHVNFQQQTSSRQQPKREPKPRAKTEASPTSPLSHSSPLKQLTNHRRKDHRRSYFFNQTINPQILKMKALVLRLDSSKKVEKLSKEDPIPKGREQEQPMLYKWSSMKPIVKQIPLLSSKQLGGLSVSFWQHFQQRKNFLLRRYKRERVNRPHLKESLIERRHKPTLTNNHI